MLLAIENHRSGLLWKLSGKNPIITTGLDRIFGINTVENKTMAINPHANHRMITLQWKSEPGASAYTIFASTDLENWQLLKAGVETTEWTDDRLPNEQPAVLPRESAPIELRLRQARGSFARWLHRSPSAA